MLFAILGTLVASRNLSFEFLISEGNLFEF